jgi:undecaprenyl diphosphate synthase
MSDGNLPSHVAVIVDGNRRWARKQQLPFFDAYKVAGSNLVEIVCSAADMGIKNVTAFTCRDPST